MRNYPQAPLPFQGQKRRFLPKFKQALNGFPKDFIYVDLFGGSGLLSHTVKQLFPEARVIWNDYDNYIDRIAAIPQTNLLLADLRRLFEGYPRKGRVTPDLKEKALVVIKRHETQYGYVDYVTLSASILFSAKYVTQFDQLVNEHFYNRIKMTDYDATGYLTGVERVQYDYKSLYNKFKDANAVYLVDPPYLSTDVSTYNKSDYWRLRDYLDVLNVLDGSNYFYFTSNKSQIVELCNWIETRTFTGNPFANSTISTTSNTLNKTAGYTDIMLYKYLE